MEAEMPGLTSGPRARGPADEWNLMDNRLISGGLVMRGDGLSLADVTISLRKP